MAVPLLEGLGAASVVDIGVDGAIRLAGVPLVADLGGPGRGGFLAGAVVVRHDSVEERQVAVGAEGVGRARGVHGVDPLGRVAFVQHARPGHEDWVFGRAPLEPFENEALGRQVVDRQTCRRRDAHVAVLADGVVRAGALRVGDLRVGHVVDFLIDGLYGIEGNEMLLGLLGGPAISKRPRENGLLFGYGRVHEESSIFECHVDGSGAVAVKHVEGIEDSL